MKRRFLFAFLSIVLEALLVSGALSAGEWFARHAKPAVRYILLRPSPWLRLRDSRYEENENLATHIPVHLPKPLHPRVGYEHHAKPSGRLEIEGPYFEHDPRVGVWPPANAHVWASKYSTDGDLMYHVLYETDAFHRRITPDAGVSPNAKPFLFLGCSFTYGEGLQNDQTMAAEVARLQKSYRVFQLFFFGLGPEQPAAPRT